MAQLKHEFIGKPRTRLWLVVQVAIVITFGILLGLFSYFTWVFGKTTAEEQGIWRAEYDKPTVECSR